MNTQNLDEQFGFVLDEQVNNNTILINSEGQKAVTIENQPDETFQTLNVDTFKDLIERGFVELKEEYGNSTYDALLKILQDSNQASNAPFSFCLYGNVKDGTEQFVGAGEGRIGEPITQDMYIRYASLTKVMGMCVLAKALEDGLIGSLDDPAYLYIPELSTIDKYVSSATLVPDTFDAYGTPVYTMNTTTIPNLGQQITIRHLVECKSGLGYSSFAFGYTRKLLNDIYGFFAFVIGFIPPALSNYIAWMQNLVGPNPTAPTAFGETAHAAYFNNMMSYTQFINQRVNYPLLFVPGTDTVYDNSLTWVGAAIGGALKNLSINKTAAEYCKEVLLNPLGMSSVWLNGGSLSPPVNVNSKFTGAFFVRDNNIDGQRGPNVQDDTLYRVNEPNANQDGYQHQAMNYFLLNKPANAQVVDPYAGGFDWSGAGSIRDYAKLVRMLMRKGKNDEGVQVLTENSVNNVVLNVKYPGMLWLLGNNTVPFLSPGANWCGGCEKFSDMAVSKIQIENPKLHKKFGETNATTYSWGGYFNNAYYFDTNSGNYMVSGTQVSDSSFLSVTGIDFEPSRAAMWNIIN